jgi:membrane-bound lytic murein transglycosylase A
MLGRMSTARSLALSVALLSVACKSAEKDYNRPLPPGAPALIEVKDRAEWPELGLDWRQRDELLPALERSIEWTKSKHARQFFPIEGVTSERALRSLERFRELYLESRNAGDFEQALRREFALYKSAGWDGRGGGVLFTAYCTPILNGSLTPDERFRFPLYGLPSDLVKGEGGSILGQATAAGIQPYPPRGVIEASGMLSGQGLELVWLRSALDAFLAHVNGSAFVRLPDGSMARFGYAGNNGREYTSLSRQLVADGKLDPKRSNLAAIREWAAANPGEVQGYLDRNERYVFFTAIDGNPRGSLNLEVTAGRTIATDKTLFPRGALVFVQDPGSGARFVDGLPVSRFMLDQDTGGAIRTAGRADLYLGVGDRAEELAGATVIEGQLYYLFLRE